MDRVAAENTRLVLLALIGLTSACVLVLLVQVLRGEEVPDLLVGLVTTLIGLLTGSAVQLGAQPKVPKVAEPLVTPGGDAPLELPVDDELLVETDAPDVVEDVELLLEDEPAPVRRRARPA